MSSYKKFYDDYFRYYFSRIEVDSKVVDDYISYAITNKIDNFIEISKLIEKKYEDLRSEYFLSLYEIDNRFMEIKETLNDNIDKQIIFRSLQSLADDLDKDKVAFIDIINMIEINDNELNELDKLVDFSKFHITDLKDIKNKTAKNYIEKN